MNSELIGDTQFYESLRERYSIRFLLRVSRQWPFVGITSLRETTVSDIRNIGCLYMGPLLETVQENTWRGEKPVICTQLDGVYCMQLPCNTRSRSPGNKGETATMAGWSARPRGLTGNSKNTGPSCTGTVSTGCYARYIIQHQDYENKNMGKTMFTVCTMTRKRACKQVKVQKHNHNLNVVKCVAS
jgi:hypothetical protein